MVLWECIYSGTVFSLHSLPNNGFSQDKNSILFANHQPSTTRMTGINHSLTISQQPHVLHSDEAF